MDKNYLRAHKSRMLAHIKMILVPKGRSCNVLSNGIFSLCIIPFNQILGGMMDDQWDFFLIFPPSVVITTKCPLVL